LDSCPDPDSAARHERTRCHPALPDLRLRALLPAPLRSPHEYVEMQRRERLPRRAQRVGSPDHRTRYPPSISNAPQCPVPVEDHTAVSTNDALRDLSTIALLDVLPALRPLTAPPTKALLNDPTPLLRASDTESEVKEGTEETGDYTVGSAR